MDAALYLFEAEKRATIYAEIACIRCLEEACPDENVKNAVNGNITRGHIRGSDACVFLTSQAGWDRAYMSALAGVAGCVPGWD